MADVAFSVGPAPIKPVRQIFHERSEASAVPILVSAGNLLRTPQMCLLNLSVKEGRPGLAALELMSQFYCVVMK